MDYFSIYSYSRKDDMGIHLGGSTINFKDDKVVLEDGYEYDDKDGDRILEGEDYYYILRKDIEKIVPIIPFYYSNVSILSDYENANEYYKKLSYNERKFFIFVLNCFKEGPKFDVLLNILNNYNIHYEHEEMRY